MSESTLRRILSFAKKNPVAPIANRKPGSGRPATITPAIQKAMKKKLEATPTMTAKQLKKIMPELANSSVRQIQDVCLKKLELPSRKMAKKPLINERMRQQRLEFARLYENWGVEE